VCITRCRSRALRYGRYARLSLPYRLRKLIGRNMGLPQKASQCAYCYYRMERYNAAYLTIGCLPLEHNMAAPLSHLHKP